MFSWDASESEIRLPQVCCIIPAVFQWHRHISILLHGIQLRRGHEDHEEKILFSSPHFTHPDACPGIFPCTFEFSVSSFRVVHVCKLFAFSCYRLSLRHNRCSIIRCVLLLELMPLKTDVCLVRFALCFWQHPAVGRSRHLLYIRRATLLNTVINLLVYFTARFSRIVAEYIMRFDALVLRIWNRRFNDGYNYKCNSTAFFQ